MINVSVLWSNGENANLDQEYYLNKHIPMLRELLGDRLKKVEVHRGLGGLAPGSPPPYLVMTHLQFESLADFQEGFAEHGAQIQGDEPNFTNIPVQVQISEIIV